MSTQCRYCGFTRLDPGQAGFNKLYASYTYQARTRGRNWSLTKEQALLLFRSSCKYCTKRPEEELITRIAVGKYSSEFIYNGIDRADNSLGYTLENTVPCCSPCNRAKKAMSETIFSTWLARVGKVHG